MGDAFIISARSCRYQGRVYYTLRYSSATWMLAKGADIHSVRAVLGQSVPSTTLNIYGHVVADLQARAAATLDETLADDGFGERKAA